MGGIETGRIDPKTLGTEDRTWQGVFARKDTRQLAGVGIHARALGLKERS